ncbi:hypothetical protein MVES1_003912 [Malassezia vespertilionis]|uniref:Uncharacterized protein n=1 Tax=Malassezia vespertilionis TaxID=2020962 RepID=A0A2N1J7X1_9BASI|nr:uncharacterized protein MVES1_003912 [Malassezia vespertilionis]PKI82654.1 hypothetical protein MVES_003467 [Malassezia vespertilionis]WFD08536.1 hypothetical protein MVES1_003912 [Malassezia vespertilionis]
MHPVAEQGFNKSATECSYDKARPSYSVQVINSILAAPQSNGPLRIVELGAGTGIATRLLLEHGGAHGGIERLEAFDPSEGMLQCLRASLFGKNGKEGEVDRLKQQGKLKQDAVVVVGEATFEDYNATPGADIVIIAQAWHWAPDFDKALRRIAATLRTGGVLALMWNLEDRSAAKWVADFRDLYERYEAGATQYRHMLWKKMEETPSYQKYYQPLPPVHIQRALPTTEQDAIDRVMSKSYISILSDEHKQLLTDKMRQILEGPDTATGRKWIDKLRGKFEYPYKTDLHMYRRT